MTFRTHTVTNLLVGELFVYSTNLVKTPAEMILFFTILIFAGLLPDVDEEKSVMSQSLPFFIARIFSSMNHRGFTHNIFGFLAATVFFGIGISYVVPQYAEVGTVAFIIGYLSHIIIGDATTYRGIEFIPGWTWRIPVFGHFLVGSKKEDKIYRFLVGVQFGAIGLAIMP